jgi:hypothetical protein
MVAACARSYVGALLAAAVQFKSTDGLFIIHRQHCLLLLCHSQNKHASSASTSQPLHHTRSNPL